MNKIIISLLIAILVVSSFGVYVASNVKTTVVNQPEVGQISTGDGYVITKTLAYTDLKTGGIAITNPVSGGSLIVDDIIVRTDEYGMGTGTLFQIYTDNNTYGTSTVMSMPVASMAASSTFALRDDNQSRKASFSATSTQATVLEDGATLRARCTVAACSSIIGATGNLTITMKFLKADRNAKIYE